MSYTPTRRGMTFWEGFIALEVVVAIAAAIFWWHEFSLYSPNAGARANAVRRLTDPEVLRRVATTDPTDWVRVNATSKITDAATLASIATGDLSPEVRRMAIKAVSDPELLARIATTDKVALVRLDAAAKVSDQRVLAALATGDSDTVLRREALKVLSDDAALLQVALDDKNEELRGLARTKLSAQKLARAASAAKDPRIALELGAAAKLLEAVQRIPDRHRARIVASLLVLSRRYADPMWTSRFGNLQSLQIDWSETWRTYNMGHRVAGEDIAFRATFTRGASPLTTHWRTLFPYQITRSRTWEPAFVNATEAVIPWLSTDQTALEKMATEDPMPLFRLAAIQKLTTRAALTRLAASDTDHGVRNAATVRLRGLPRP